MTATEISCGDVLASARAAADRMGRAYSLPLAGTRTEERSVAVKGRFGRTETVAQRVEIPIPMPGWPLGIEVQVGTTSKGATTHLVVLSPNGELLSVERDASEPTIEIRSNRLLNAVRLAQYGSEVSWHSTGNGSDRAAQYTRVITATAAARRIIDHLDAMR